VYNNRIAPLRDPIDERVKASEAPPRVVAQRYIGTYIQSKDSILTM
jgi:hypothetical protein